MNATVSGDRSGRGPLHGIPAFAIAAGLAFLLLVLPRCADAEEAAGAPRVRDTAAAVDPLNAYLRDLADSTDAYFGSDAAVFDTTGLDSLLRLEESTRAEPGRSRRHEAGVRLQPQVGFHRATGHVLGIAANGTLSPRTTLEAGMSYGFSNREGRYRVGLERFHPLGPGADSSRLVLGLRYGRETLSFAPEHETKFVSQWAAFFTGRNEQSVYQSRGGSISLAWRTRSRLISLGWRAARDQPMSLRSRFPPWGDDALIPEVTAARGGSYHEVLASLGNRRAVAEVRYTSSSRWRTRTGAALTGIFAGIEAHLQAEAGAAAEDSPPQHRFELGGPEAVPTLGFGDEFGNRLALGKLELVHGLELTRALPSSFRFLALHPALFVHEGASWTAEDGDYARPLDAAWRGAAGFALIHVPGFPRESTYVRLQVAWPLGPESGSSSVSLTIGDWFDLVH